MKALTIHQPFATLIAIGEKAIETRGWDTRELEPMAIHAAKCWTKDQIVLCNSEPFASVLRPFRGAQVAPGLFDYALPFGSIVAIAALHDIYPTEAVKLVLAAAPGQRGNEWVGTGEHELAFGDYRRGRYAWIFRDVERLAYPVPCRGYQKLWTVPPDVVGRLAMVGRVA